eukprot:scaffold411603_cov19-Prasinocladus_malaysianus.AAC.1
MTAPRELSPAEADTHEHLAYEGQSHTFGAPQNRSIGSLDFKPMSQYTTSTSWEPSGHMDGAAGTNHEHNTLLSSLNRSTADADQPKTTLPPTAAPSASA